MRTLVDIYKGLIYAYHVIGIYILYSCGFVQPFVHTVGLKLDPMF